MKDFKFFRSEPLYWITAMGEGKLISTMSGEHIVNVTRIIRDGQVPNPYQGKTNIEWLNIFEQELRNRQVRWER